MSNRLGQVGLVPATWQSLLQPDCVGSFEALLASCQVPAVPVEASAHSAADGGAPCDVHALMQEIQAAYAAQSKKMAGHASKLQAFSALAVCVLL